MRATPGIKNDVDPDAYLAAVRVALEDLVYLLDNDRPGRMSALEASNLAREALEHRFAGASFDLEPHVDVRSLRRPVCIRRIHDQALHEGIESLCSELAERGVDLSADCVALVIGWSESLGLVVATVQDTRGMGLIVTASDTEAGFRVCAQETAATSVKITPVAPLDVRIVETGHDYSVLDTGRHLYSVPNRIANALARARRHQHQHR